MEGSNGIEHLLLIITDAPSADLEVNWIANLAYLGTQARQGFWANINPLERMTSEEIWSFFTTGSTNSQAMEVPFWKILEGSGKVVFVHGTPPGVTPHIQTETDDLNQLVKQDDWQLLMAFIYRDTLLGHGQPNGENVPIWELVDKAVESLALAAGSQTTLLVVALPDPDEGRGIVVAGGYQIAPLGNPGPVNLIDIPPTISWLLGAEVPASSSSRILKDILKSDSDLTQDEMDILTEHLRGLGYLG
jgi:hypothetical protein